jgi:ribonuclease P protein component
MSSDRLDPSEQQPPPQRLKRRPEFLRVAAKGRKIPTKGVVVQALACPDQASVRLGFTVTKKVGNAVVRNRTKRRLREAARLYLREHRVAPADLVFVGRDGTRGRKFDRLIADIAQALEKAGLA